MAGIQPAALCSRWQMVCSEVPWKRIHPPFTHFEASIVAVFEGELLQAVYSNSLCCIDYNPSNSISLFQPSVRDSWSSHLLAFINIFPCGNVLESEKYSSMDRMVDFSKNFLLCLLSGYVICSIGINWRACKCKIKLRVYCFRDRCIKGDTGRFA